jgi:hypothetical protein
MEKAILVLTAGTVDTLWYVFAAGLIYKVILKFLCLLQTS